MKLKVTLRIETGNSAKERSEEMHINMAYLAEHAAKYAKSIDAIVKEEALRLFQSLNETTAT